MIVDDCWLMIVDDCWWLLMLWLNQSIWISIQQHPTINHQQPRRRKITNPDPYSNQVEPAMLALKLLTLFVTDSIDGASCPATPHRFFRCAVGLQWANTTVRVQRCPLEVCFALSQRFAVVCVDCFRRTRELQSMHARQSCKQQMPLTIAGQEAHMQSRQVCFFKSLYFIQSIHARQSCKQQMPLTIAGQEAHMQSRQVGLFKSLYFIQSIHARQSCKQQMPLTIAGQEAHMQSRQVSFFKSLYFRVALSNKETYIPGDINMNIKNIYIYIYTQ